MADLPVYQYPRAGINPTASPVASLEGPYQAIQAGEQTGLAVPSIGSAIATGIQDAYTTYTKNAYVEAQTENLKAETALNNAKVAATLGGPDAKTQSEIDLNKSRIAFNESKTQDTQGLGAISQSVASGDPNQIKAILSNPQAVQAIIKNSKDAPTLLGLMRTRLGGDQEGQQMIDKLSDNIKQYDYANQKETFDQHLRTQQTTDGLNAIKTVMDDGTIQTLGLASGSHYPNEVFGRYQTVPHGQKTFDKITQKMMDDPDGQYSADTDKGWDVVDTQNENKRVATLSNEKGTAFNKAKAAYDSIDETRLRSVFGVPYGVKLNKAKLLGQTPSPASPSPQPAPTPANTNKNIVSSVPGTPSIKIPGATFQQRMVVRQQAIQARKFAAQGQSPVSSLVPSPATTPAPTPTTTSTPAPVPTPDQGISKVSPTPLALKEGNTGYHVNPVVYNNINSDPNLLYSPAAIKGLAAIESGPKGNGAVSPTGVRGILQVTKATARQFGFNRDVPWQQVAAGTAYFNSLLDQFNGNVALAYAGYSAAGPGSIDRAIKETGSTDWRVIKKQLKTFLAPDVYDQVENYPERAIHAASQFIDPTSPFDQQFVSLLITNGYAVPA